MTIELMDFESAAKLAMEETSQASEAEAEPALPAVEAEPVVESGQADEKIEEQPESQEDAEASPDGVATADEEESLFAGIEIEDEPQGPVFDDDTPIEVPGVEAPVSLKELRDGYLRQGDYTQKTQLVAEQRKQNEKAIAFVEALQGNQEAVIRQLAEQAGLIEPGAHPFKVVEFSPIRTLEETQAEVERQVAEAVEVHPAVQAAKRQEALAIIDQEFDRIGQLNEVAISLADREVVLKEAQRRGVADLELVFTSLMSQRAKRVADKQALKDAAPSRPTGNVSSEANSNHADSFEEAAAMALAEIGMK